MQFIDPGRTWYLVLAGENSLHTINFGEICIPGLKKKTKKKNDRNCHKNAANPRQKSEKPIEIIRIEYSV